MESSAQGARKALKTIVLIWFILICISTLTNNEFSLTQKITGVIINSLVLFVSYFIATKVQEKFIKKRELKSKESVKYKN